jgi:hypothetical protein
VRSATTGRLLCYAPPGLAAAMSVPAAQALAAIDVDVDAGSR